jgi:hypothetical protein
MGCLSEVLFSILPSRDVPVDFINVVIVILRPAELDSSRELRERNSTGLLNKHIVRVDAKSSSDDSVKQ